MIVVRIDGDKFLARCPHCGQWREVQPCPHSSDTYFAYWEGPFSCCGRQETVTFAVEKDEIDIH